MSPRTLRIGLAQFYLAISLCILVPGSALALSFTNSGHASLAGALVQTFDAEPLDTYFSSRTFLIGSDGFTVNSVAGELHLDDEFCASFGTTGSCLDTLNNAGQPNDDLDVVFTGLGVTAFGFALNALDADWTVSTFDANAVLMGTYVIPSQSPGLTNFNRRGFFGVTEASAIQYITIRSAGNDRALIDDFSYVPVPEPNVLILISLGMLILAGTRAGEQGCRSQAPIALPN
jgi:hypothetical protein